MKHEIEAARPPYLTSAWPGKYELFSWLDYAVNIPYPIVLVTTYKENGKPNACLHSCGCFGGDEAGYYSILTMLDSYHTAGNIRRSGEWCINVPPADHVERCMKTIERNAPEDDEIVDAGFTVEPAQRVNAPRIAECPVNLECTLVWDRALGEGSGWHVFAGRVEHVAMDDAAFELDPAKRLKILRMMANVRSTLNPLTGEAGASGLPVIGEG